MAAESFFTGATQAFELLGVLAMALGALFAFVLAAHFVVAWRHARRAPAPEPAGDAADS